MELRCHLRQAGQTKPPPFSDLSHLWVPSSIYLNQLEFVICELVLSLLKDHKSLDSSNHLLAFSPGSQQALIKCLPK